jgi:hypothetical protein
LNNKRVQVTLRVTGCDHKYLERSYGLCGCAHATVRTARATATKTDGCRLLRNSSLDATNLDDGDTADGLNGDVESTSHAHENDGPRHNYLAYGTAQPNTRNGGVGDSTVSRIVTWWQSPTGRQQKKTHKIQFGTNDLRNPFTCSQVPPRSVMPARWSAPTEKFAKIPSSACYRSEPVVVARYE